MINETTKFLGVDSTKVDLTEKKDLNNNSKTEYYSLQEIKGYKVYTAIVSQSGTNAPTALVLEDTLGAVEWSYNSIGQYKLLFSDSVLNQDKTFILKDFSYDKNSGSILVYRENNTSLVVETKDFEGTPANNILTAFTIEVRVYE